MGEVETFRRIAEVLRATQRAAIEVENAPDQRKRLRSFSVQEAAGLLGVTQRELRSALPAEGPRSAQPRARLSFAELQALRAALDAREPGRLLRRRDPARGEALATVVFTNFKGGSAKTTSSVHFAQYMALAGYRVLLVDLDSQGSTTAQFGLDPATEVGRHNSFAAWLPGPDGRRPDPRSLRQPTYWPSIDLIPAGAVLAEAEEALARRAAAGAPEPILYFEELAGFLGAIGADYDIAVVDTRPDVNMLMTAALHAATGLVVPTRATMTDLASTGEFFAHLAGYVGDFRAAFGRGLDFAFARILVSAFDPTDRSQEALAGLLRERFGDTVLPGEFLHSRVMGTAGFGKETLYEYEPSTDRAAYNRVLASANAVNGAIEQAVLAAWGRAPAAEAAA